VCNYARLQAVTQYVYRYGISKYPREERKRRKEKKTEKNNSNKLFVGKIGFREVLYISSSI
jgi:hypothetical protein